MSFCNSTDYQRPRSFIYHLWNTYLPPLEYFFLVLFTTFVILINTYYFVSGKLFSTFAYRKHLNHTDMEKTLSALKDIENKARNLNRQINDEGRVYAEELADRKRKHLTGEDGRKHYNDWMAAHGMEHLMIK